MAFLAHPLAPVVAMALATAIVFRLVEAIVFFRPTFDGTWLEAAWAIGDEPQLEFGGAMDSIR